MSHFLLETILCPLGGQSIECGCTFCSLHDCRSAFPVARNKYRCSVNDLQHAAQCTAHTNNKNPRRGRERDATLLRSRNGHVHVWLRCLMWGNRLAFCCSLFSLFFSLYTRASGGPGGMQWGLNVTVLFSPSCAALGLPLGSLYF